MLVSGGGDWVCKFVWVPDDAAARGGDQAHSRSQERATRNDGESETESERSCEQASRPGVGRSARRLGAATSHRASFSGASTAAARRTSAAEHNYSKETSADACLFQDPRVEEQLTDRTREQFLFLIPIVCIMDFLFFKIWYTFSHLELIVGRCSKPSYKSDMKSSHVG